MSVGRAPARAGGEDGQCLIRSPEIGWPGRSTNSLAEALLTRHRTLLIQK